MDSHEYASIFPMASSEELIEMSNDIKKRGLLNPIITLDGKVLDGRNRLRACEMAKVIPTTIEYTGVDPLGDVLSWNLHRRQLTTSQRAAVALQIKPMFEEQAKERQGARNDIGTNSSRSENTRSAVQAAKAVNVGASIVKDAQFVRDHDPEAFEQVKAGTITVNKAKEQIKEQAQVKEEERYTDPLCTRKSTKEVDNDVDADDETIAGLRRYWRKANKKQKASFLAWINTNK